MSTKFEEFIIEVTVNLFEVSVSKFVC